MAPVAETAPYMGAVHAQCLPSDVCSAAACVVPPQQLGDVADARWAKRVKSVLASFPAFVSVQHQQQLQLDSAAQQPACAERQQYAARRISARDQAKPPKIRRVSCLDDERPAGVYDREYLSHCLADEAKGAVDWSYLSSVQCEVDAHKRLVLVDWLVEVCDEFKLCQETLFLAVNLIDRYLSRRPVPRAALQLLGVGSLWLACKFVEVYPPTLADFVDVTQHSCCAAQLVQMEESLLRELGFTLMVPTAVTFLTLFLPAAAANAADADAHLSAAIDGDGCDSDDSSPAGSSGGCGGGGGRVPAADAPTGPRGAPRYPYPLGGPCPSEPCGGGAGGALGGGFVAPPPSALGDFPRRVAHLAEYLAELSLLTPECLRFPPSLVAAAALSLACSLLDAPPGTRARLAPGADAAVAAAGPRGEERARECVGELRRMFAYAARAPRPPAVKAKYCSPKRSCAAATPLPRWALDP